MYEGNHADCRSGGHFSGAVDQEDGILQTWGKMCKSGEGYLTNQGLKTYFKHLTSWLSNTVGKWQVQV